MRHPLVLCLDDELEGLIGREALLRQAGCRVLISTSPQEALKLFAGCSVDAVVLDFQMPEMRGDAVAARMKRLKPDVPIMLLSAQDSFPNGISDLVDVVFSKREAPRKFVAAVLVLVAERENFFLKWLREWQYKSAACY